MRGVLIIKTKDEAADALTQVIQDIADPEGICVGKIRCDGEVNSGQGFKHWRSYLEYRLRPTHRIFLKEILSQSVVLASSCYAQPTSRSSSPS